MQLLDPGQGVEDRLSHFGFAGDARELRREPSFEIVQDRL